MPATLQTLMRHADINTTMKYYVGQNTDAMAASIWAAVAAQPQVSGASA
jgi:integrase